MTKPGAERYDDTRSLILSPSQSVNTVRSAQECGAGETSNHDLDDCFTVPTHERLTLSFNTTTSLPCPLPGQLELATLADIVASLQPAEQFISSILFQWQNRMCARLSVLRMTLSFLSNLSGI
jgi:hypothetical protein